MLQNLSNQNNSGRSQAVTNACIDQLENDIACINSEICTIKQCNTSQQNQINTNSCWSRGKCIYNNPLRAKCGLDTLSSWFGTHCIINNSDYYDLLIKSGGKDICLCTNKCIVLDGCVNLPVGSRVKVGSCTLSNTIAKADIAYACMNATVATANCAVTCAQNVQTCLDNYKTAIAQCVKTSCVDADEVTTTDLNANDINANQIDVGLINALCLKNSIDYGQVCCKITLPQVSDLVIVKPPLNNIYDGEYIIDDENGNVGTAEIQKVGDNVVVRVTGNVFVTKEGVIAANTGTVNPYCVYYKANGIGDTPTLPIIYCDSAANFASQYPDAITNTSDTTYILSDCGITDAEYYVCGTFCANTFGANCLSVNCLESNNINNTNTICSSIYCGACSIITDTESDNSVVHCDLEVENDIHSCHNIVADCDVIANNVVGVAAVCSCGNLQVDGNSVICQNATICGNETIEGNLEVCTNSTFDGTVTICGTTNAKDNVTLDKNLEVCGETTLCDNVVIINDCTIITSNCNVTIDGTCVDITSSTCNISIDAKNNVVVGADCDIQLYADGNISTCGCFVHNDNMLICGDLTICGAATISGFSADNVTAQTTSDNDTFYPFITKCSCSLPEPSPAFTNCDLSYNPSSGTLTTKKVSAVNLCGTCDIQSPTICGDVITANCCFCGNLCGTAACATTICRNAVATGICHLLLTLGATSAAGTNVYVSSGCPLTFNTGTGVLSAKTFCGALDGLAKGTNKYDCYCMDFFTGCADRDLLFTPNLPATNVSFTGTIGASTCCKFTVNPNTGVLTAGTLCTNKVELSAPNSTSGIGSIYGHGTCATTEMICFLNNTNDPNGNGISIGAGGITIIGAGESAGTTWAGVSGSSNRYGACASDEKLYLASDGNITLLSNVGGGYACRKTATFDASGVFTAPTFCGNLCGNAACASNIYRNSCTAGTYHLAFFGGTTAGAGAPLYVSSGCQISYNMGTGVLTAPTFCGSLSGNASCASKVQRNNTTTNGIFPLAIFNGSATVSNADLYTTSCIGVNPSGGYIQYCNNDIKITSTKAADVSVSLAVPSGNTIGPNSVSILGVACCAASIAIGTCAKANGVDNIAIGRNASIIYCGGIAIGCGATVCNSKGIALGISAKASSCCGVCKEIHIKGGASLGMSLLTFGCQDQQCTLYKGLCTYLFGCHPVLGYAISCQTGCVSLINNVCCTPNSVTFKNGTSGVISISCTCTTCVPYHFVGLVIDY